MTQATTQTRAQFARETDAGGRFVRQVSRFPDSAAVIRMLDSAWDEWGDRSVDHVTHDSIDPTGIVPKGPEPDLTQPHDRQS